MIHLFFIFRETIEIVLIIMKTYTTIQENQSKDLGGPASTSSGPREKKKTTSIKWFKEFKEWNLKRKDKMKFKEFHAKYGELWNFMQELKILYPTRPKLRILKGFGLLVGFGLTFWNLLGFHFYRSSIQIWPIIYLNY